MSGLASDWDSNNHPVIPDPIDPEYINPNQSPADTDYERKVFFDTIQLNLDANAKIPLTSSCEIPEAIVALDTVPGQKAYRAPYPIANAHIPTVQKQVDDWLRDEVITIAPPNTEFNSPLLVVPKKGPNGEYDEEIRPCLDIRKLNSTPTNIDRFPLPLISELHQKMGNAKFFTTLDLKQAFHRFPIRKEDQPKTSFTFNGIQYMFKKVPFGLAPVSALVQRTLTNLFADLPYVTISIDDLTVFTDKDTNHHAECLNELYWP
ncbi:hypothetical protein RO3G_03326 [Rhizopus delemar RA 99-880]|uniref:Reverse transcriptase domain-containing protein n=1 Tax=Rhizopus delemar (strain RA 99-880 / ATCC MYA-4621 / FGSC 9543 / NRRL 43880) TaxID=246409 RepID=I1BQZ2_RHIO9|nr:hypothetical protein RO3G_03326 [Rhizopus delemar RA 99-880]|eukprot:EIE78622.1 hypothetical protein RO3G_03326 [Rhizopus delemar RA 99-880]